MAVERNEDRVEGGSNGERIHSDGECRLPVSADPENEQVDKLERVRSYLTDCQTCRRRSVLFFREHTFLRREPATMTCPNCLCGIETAVERRATMKTHLSALLLLPVCLCVFPYYSKELRDTLHRCPACGVHLGSNFASVREACIVCAGHIHRHNAEDDAGQQHL